MTQTFTVFRASLKMLLRDRTALFGAVMFPLFFVLAMSIFDLRFERMSGVPASDNYFDFVLPGLLALGVMNFTLVGIATSVTGLRGMRILRRIQATPLRPARFIAGQIGARLVIALGQLVLMLALGVGLGGAMRGNWLVVLALGAVGNVVFLGFGFAVAGRASTVDGAANLASLVTLPLMFLTGLYFPLEAMPSVLQGAARWLPMTALIDAMRSVMLHGLGLGDLGPELALLFVWAAIGVVAARLSFRFGG